MDNERYARYLDDDSLYSDGSLGDDKKSSSDNNDSKTSKCKSTGIQLAFEDAKNKLGLGGVSNASAILLALVILAVVAFGIWSYSPSLRAVFADNDGQGGITLTKAEDEDELSSVSSDGEEGTDGEVAASPTGTIFVYLSGAVKQPDVYELPAGARAVDAVNAAGGFLDSAASEALNLAAELEDGTQIHVLTKEEFKEQGGSVAAITGGSSSQAAVGSSDGNSLGSDSDGLVNLNTADSTTLQTLPGIGPVTADKIVKDREVNGPYSNLEDLMRVSGIGPKRVEGLEGVASVGP